MLLAGRLVVHFLWLHASTNPGSSQLANKECMSLGCIDAIICIADGVVVHWLCNLSLILTNGMHQAMHGSSQGTKSVSWVAIYIQ